MTHLGTKTIETERLILRRFTMDDADAAFRNWMSDPKVTEFLRWQPHKDIAETRETLASWIGMYDDPTMYQWAIELKELGEPIGSISVVSRNDAIEMIHTGYCIGSRWWGGGIVTEAYKAVIRYFFEEVGVNRIESQHDPNNPASGKVMQKCGLRYEGTLRGADYNNKGIVDAAVYGMLREDYFGLN